MKVEFKTIAKEAMEFKLSFIKSALRFVSGESTHVCRLCFASTEHDEINLQDLVTVEWSHLDERISICDMFHALGVPNEPSLPQTICGQCAMITINSYLFQMLCHYSVERWSEALDCLDKGVSQSDAISLSAKTVCFLINQTRQSIVTSRSSLGRNKMAVAKKLHSLATKKSLKEEAGEHQSFICTVCPEYFDSKTGLNKHMKIHIDNHRIACTQCPRRFISQMRLKDHAERVHNPKTIQCPKCSLMFSSERMLRRHVMLCHQAVTCNLCSMEYPSRKSLRAHLDKHEIKKCSNCGKGFQNRQVYRLHVKICSSKEKGPSCYCDICARGYRRKNSLRTHLKTDHGFGKTFDCNWCNKKFDALSRLKNHTVKHTKERNFFCEHCGGHFVTQAALTYHVRLHTGEKPFACDLCDERFLSASRRAEHKRRKHIGPQLECTACYAKFGTKYQLFKHTSRHSNPHSKLYMPSFQSNDIS